MSSGASQAGTTAWFPPHRLSHTFPSPLPLHLVKSPEVKLIDLQGNQARAEPGTGYTFSGRTNVSTWATSSGHRAGSREALSSPHGYACRSSLGGKLRSPLTTWRPGAH